MSIAFKEWTLVCGALGRGEQSVIVRKGGIAEGRDGFRFKHDEFFLFPTLFHEQVAKTKLPADTPLPARTAGIIEIELSARVEWTTLLTDWDTVSKLAPFHIWRDDEIAARFRYDDVPGVNVAFVRVFKLSQPWTFPDAPAYGGCRSWVELPEPPAAAARFEPVLDDATHRARAEALAGILGRPVSKR
jgi:hypothetical protein